jgi:calcineurin-like phosphoesterase family protein
MGWILGFRQPTYVNKLSYTTESLYNTTPAEYLYLEINDYRLILMHYPIASWNNMNKGVIHLHGHVHLPPDKKISKGKAMDVGMDGNNMELYSLMDIINIMDKQPISKLSLPQDHHEPK